MLHLCQVSKTDVKTLGNSSECIQYSDCTKPIHSSDATTSKLSDTSKPPAIPEGASRTTKTERSKRLERRLSWYNMHTTEKSTWTKEGKPFKSNATTWEDHRPDKPSRATDEGGDRIYKFIEQCSGEGAVHNNSIYIYKKNNPASLAH